MKDEIKEIFDLYAKQATNSDLAILIKTLKEWYFEKEDYKSRNEKAIEYIMTELITEWAIENDGYVSGSDLPVDAITPLLNILEGDDKNE